MELALLRKVDTPHLTSALTPSSAPNNSGIPDHLTSRTSNGNHLLTRPRVSPEGTCRCLVLPACAAYRCTEPQIQTRAEPEGHAWDRVTGHEGQGLAQPSCHPR